MALPGSILLLTGRAHACDDAPARIDEALEHVVQADLQGAREALTAAEAAFACAPVPAVDLARYWLVDAAVAAFAGHDDDADEAFRAAARAEPETWLVDLGPGLLDRREAAVAAVQPNGGLALADAVGYRVVVDGRDLPLPADLPSGLHLVQIAEGDTVRFGLVVFVLPGQPSLVETGLASLDAPVAPASTVVAPAPATRRRGSSIGVTPRAGAGASLAFGRSFELRSPDGDPLVEPATKVLVPVEVGVRVGTGPAWVRACAAVAPMVSGRLLFLGADGVHGTPLGVEPHLAVGARFQPLDAGVALGLLLPSRVSAAAVIGVRPGELPILPELRVGAHFLSDRTPEPTVTLLVAFEPEGPSW